MIFMGEASLRYAITRVSESLSCGAEPSGSRQSVDRPGARSGPDNQASQAPRPPGRPTELLLSRGRISWAGKHPTPTLSIGYRRPNISTLRDTPEGTRCHGQPGA